MARVVVFTMSYRDQWAAKIACCEILETILDTIQNLRSISEPVTVRFRKPEITIFRAQTIHYNGYDVEVNHINRSDLPEGLSREQWVELLGLELRALLNIAGFKCEHKVMETDETGAFDLIFTPR